MGKVGAYEHSGEAYTDLYDPEDCPQKCLYAPDRGKEHILNFTSLHVIYVYIQ